jgi:hypothetical protein
MGRIRRSFRTIIYRRLPKTRIDLKEEKGRKRKKTEEKK